MADQFMRWAVSKATGQKMEDVVITEARVDNIEDDDDENNDDEKTTVEDSLSEEQKNNPIATYANAAGTCFLPEQWFALMENKNFKKKDIKVLKRVLTSKTDTECIAAYDEFKALEPEKLFSLYAVLNEEQQQMLKQLGELVDAAKQTQED